MTETPGRNDAFAWREEARTIAIAFGYFTRLPMPPGIVFTEARLARSGRYFPLVGAVVGAMGALVFAVGSHFWPVPIAVLLSMATTLLATGALHEDGLADCCDAFGGGYRRADVLRILKDSRIGVFGGIGLIITLALKWQALVGLAAWGPGVVCAWMIAAHAASRAGAIVFTATLDYARATVDAQSGGFGAPSAAGAADAVDGSVGPSVHTAAFSASVAQTPETLSPSDADLTNVGTPSPPQEDDTVPTSIDAKAGPFQRSQQSDARRNAARNGAAIALLLGLPGLFWHSVPLGATLVIAGALLYWSLGRWWRRRIGGYTGDCLGLAQQLFEVGIYLMVLGWISS